MKRVMLISLIFFCTIIAKADNKPTKEEIEIEKIREGDSAITRSLFVFTVEAHINHSTSQLNVDFNAPMLNNTIYLVDQAGSTITTHNASMQTQVSLPLPQQAGYYTVVIVANGAEYSGEFYIEK